MHFFCSSASKHVSSIPSHVGEESRSIVEDHKHGNDSTDDLPDKDGHGAKDLGLGDDEHGDNDL